MVEVLIISPDSDLTVSLQKALSDLKTVGRAVILRQYPSYAQLVKLLHKKRPHAIIVGLSNPNQALELIEGIRAGYPDILVVASHVVNTSNLILDAVRAGASEYIGPPFERQHLEQALVGAVEAEAKTRPKGRLIAFLPVQGGCGASTIALQVASTLRGQSGKRTLLLDFDSHSGTVDFRLRLKPRYTLADALQRSGSLDDLWGQLVCHWGELEILPPVPLQPLVQAEHYARTSALLVSACRVYEWVVGDLPPAIYTSCLDLLAQAETIYLVCTPDLVSLHLASRRVRELGALGISARDTLRLVVNRVGRGKHALGPQEVEQTVGIPVTWAIPNDWAAVSQALMKARLVAESSMLGQQCASFARSIIGVPERKPNAPGWKKWLSQIGTSLPLFPPESRVRSAVP